MTPDELYEIRNQLYLTQAELAEKLGVKPDTVRSWESGRREPGAPALKLLRGLAAQNGNNSAIKTQTTALIQAIVWIAEDIEAQLASLAERIRKLENK